MGRVGCDVRQREQERLGEEAPDVERDASESVDPSWETVTDAEQGCEMLCESITIPSNQRVSTPDILCLPEGMHDAVNMALAQRSLPKLDRRPKAHGGTLPRSHLKYAARRLHMAAERELAAVHFDGAVEDAEPAVDEHVVEARDGIRVGSDEDVVDVEVDGVCC